jgi:death-on-curing protein
VSDWVWIDPDVLLAAHDEQLEEHGGATGIRDRGLFESALARPQNLAVYGEPGVATLAASYGFGLAKNHAFVDGNKRTAFVALELFLDLNGFELTADDAQCVLVMLSVASGAFSESELADWIGKHMKAR